MDTKRIAICVRQIEKSTADRSYEKLQTVLCDLDKTEVTAELLETTDIVKVLYRLLKTCSDHTTKRTIRHLLSKWKRQYSKDMHGVEKRCSRAACGTGCGDGGAPPEDGAQTVKAADEDASGDLQPKPHTPDLSSIRSKCAELLLSAVCAHQPSHAGAAQLATDIERHVHRLHRANLPRYKACVRSKVANLRNPRNGHLRDGLLSGSLSAEAFARMSAEEMAGVELRRLRQEISARAVNERQLPRGPRGAPTQKIRCKRCGGRDCEVTQVSRGTLFLPSWVRESGPDHDAMTFVTCSGCGQQWYHSGWNCL